MRNLEKYIRVAGLATVVALGTAACSSSSQSTPKAATHKTSPELTFDALGGGSNVIKVYPGPLDNPTDETYSGTFLSGQMKVPICEAIGRTVTSDTAVGESYRQSDKWYEVEVGSTHYFATGTYADVTGHVPACNDVK